MNHNMVAILDFGGQYAHLIANRVRRLGVYSEILDPETPAKTLKGYKGIILSGSPASVYEKASPTCDADIFKLGIPLLGICYGHQIMQQQLGGKVDSVAAKEYGLAKFRVKKAAGVFSKFPKSSQAWMSHGDTVIKLAPGFVVAGITEDCPFAAVADTKRHFYGVQFHPEVTHTAHGMKLFEAFLKITGARRDWNMTRFMEEEIGRIKAKIGDRKVFLLVSGGVDSAVCFALLEKALGKSRVYGLLVDTGLMRLDEAKKVKIALNKAGFSNLHVASKGAEFFRALKGVTHPEAKRKIIGDLFWKVKEDVAKELGLNGKEWVMGQGTIYPDTIETGGTKHADKIKTHHNRVDLVQQMIREGRVIEPLAQLYKDEVRALGEKLGLPKTMVWRQPFPGPGLGVRILCADKTVAGRPTDFTLLNEEIGSYLRKHFKLFDCVLRVLPIQSVGVQGDARTYRHPVVLFTALRDWDKLEQASTAITNHFSQVNRVLLALYGEAGCFLLTPSDLNPARARVLQKADDAVTAVMQKAPRDYGIWQFPVVLLPVSTAKKHESIVLRPIVSTEAMTASFARIDWKVVGQLVDIVKKDKSLSHIFYDLTHKPPGTIEWE
ncbi:glutamine-hydrolyzing GMP synthase [Candidatus Peregrinibacteria bacterium]|nr:glutamine-hydrolyzing GMP synthase [Candidatus Peregrinibacteria bacterium]